MAALPLARTEGKSTTAATAAARVFASTGSSEGAASSAQAPAFVNTADTDTDAKSARAPVFALMERRGMCAIRAAARACAPTVVIGTDALNARARAYASTAGARMRAGSVLHLILPMTNLRSNNSRALRLRQLQAVKHPTQAFFHESTAFSYIFQQLTLSVAK